MKRRSKKRKRTRGGSVKGRPTERFRYRGNCAESRRVPAFKSKAEPRIYRNQRSPPYLGDGGKSA